MQDRVKAKFGLFFQLSHHIILYLEEYHSALIATSVTSNIIHELV